LSEQLHDPQGSKDSRREDVDAMAIIGMAFRFPGDLADEAEGYPDGMCFDTEGCVWVAHWGAGCVSRFAPDATLLRRVSLPTSHITNVCFGGAGLDRLFVSSARAGLSEDQLCREPLAGALFEVLEPGAIGLPGRPYGRV
jgi:sugar lactone lactonase YvrE